MGIDLSKWSCCLPRPAAKQVGGIWSWLIRSRSSIQNPDAETVPAHDGSGGIPQDVVVEVVAGGNRLSIGKPGRPRCERRIARLESICREGEAPLDDEDSEGVVNPEIDRICGCGPGCPRMRVRRGDACVGLNQRWAGGSELVGNAPERGNRSVGKRSGGFVAAGNPQADGDRESEEEEVRIGFHERAFQERNRIDHAVSDPAFSIYPARLPCRSA